MMGGTLKRLNIMRVHIAPNGCDRAWQTKDCAVR